MLHFKQWMLDEQASADDFPKSRFELTRSQKAAINRYKGQGYMYDIKISRKTLDDMINKAPPTTKDNVVYRGIRGEPKMDKNGLSINDSLVSTSVSIDVAKAFAGLTGQNAHVISIVIPKGSRVLNLMQYGEKEILLKSQSRIRYNKEPTKINNQTFWHAVLEFDGTKR